MCPAFQVPGRHRRADRRRQRYNLIAENDVLGQLAQRGDDVLRPGAIRGTLDVAAQLDTSNTTGWLGNRFGFHPSGVAQPNGHGRVVGRPGHGQLLSRTTRRPPAPSPTTPCYLPSLPPDVAARRSATPSRWRSCCSARSTTATPTPTRPTATGSTRRRAGWAPGRRGGGGAVVAVDHRRPDDADVRRHHRRPWGSGVAAAPTTLPSTGTIPPWVPALAGADGRGDAPDLRCLRRA